MKRLSYFALTALLTAGLSVPAFSQATPKATDPCAQYKTAPKNESAADKKKRQADLKTCTDKVKADKAAAKQQSSPAKKSSGTKKPSSKK
jgi:hypothetical protein